MKNNCQFIINRSVLVLSIALFLCGNSSAGVIDVQNSIRLFEMESSDLVFVEDQYFEEILGGESVGVFTIEQQLLISRLRFDDSQKDYYGAPWDLTLEYDLFTIDINGNYELLTAQQMMLSYHPDADYTDIVIEPRENIIYAQATNLSIANSNGLDLQNLPEDIYFDLILRSEKNFDLIPGSSPLLTKTLVDNSGILSLAWTHIQGAESYDLEWKFYDLGTDAASSIGALTPDFSDASRINLTNHFFDLPLGYPHGVFIFRVRGVGTDLITGKRVEGDWNLDPSSTYLDLSSDPFKYFEFVGLEPSHNWQFSQSFAEDGLNGESLIIADGMLRQRQSITYSPTDDSRLIQNQIYDVEGRPSISVITTPRQNDGLKFYPGQLSDGTDHFDFSDFDTWVDGEFDNLQNPQPINHDAGNPEGPDYYYSSDNSNPLGMHGEYTPDAEGYPYSRTVLMDDGTDRVRVQTNVGADFRLGASEEHVNRYYYGTPSQEELDELFGNEVGFAAHYKKQMMIDVNGQAHMTITDQAGRTIATFLAGPDPDNLTALDHIDTDGNGTLNDGEGEENESIDLSEYNEPDPYMQLVSSYTFTVSHLTEYSFEYALDPTCLDPEQCDILCQECRYDLVIELFEEVSDDLTTSHVLLEDYTYINEDFAIDEGYVSPPFDLPQGTYLIQKTLSITQASIDAAVSSFVADQTCVELQNTLQVDCSTCDEDCLNTHYHIEGDEVYFIDPLTYDITLVGTGFDVNAGDLAAQLATIQYVGSYEQLVIEVNALVEACALECVAPSFQLPDRCQLLYNTMLGDMSPGGQYFDNTPEELDEFGNYNPNYDENYWLETQYPFAPTAPYYDWLCENPNLTILDSYASFDEIRDDWDQILEAGGALFEAAWFAEHPEYCFYDYQCQTRIDVTVGNCVPPVDENPLSYYHYIENALTDAQTVVDGELTADWDLGNGLHWFNPLAMDYNDNLSPNADPWMFDHSNYLPANWDCTAPESEHDAFVIDQFEDESWPMDLRTSLNKFLQIIDYQGNPSGDYYSIWYFLDNPHAIENDPILFGGLSSDILEIFEEFHGPDGVFTTGQLTKYQFFIGAYQFYRDLGLHVLHSECIANNCNAQGPCDDCAFLDSGYDEGDGLLDGFDFYSNSTDDGFLIRFPMNPIYEELYQNMDPQTYEFDYQDLDDLFQEGGLFYQAQQNTCNIQCQAVAESMVMEYWDEGQADCLDPDDISMLIALAAELCAGGCQNGGMGSMSYDEPEDTYYVEADFPNPNTQYTNINDLLEAASIEYLGQQSCAMPDFVYPADEVSPADLDIACNCANLESLLSAQDPAILLDDLDNGALEAEILDLLQDFQNISSPNITSTDLSQWKDMCMNDGTTALSNFPEELSCAIMYAPPIMGDCESTVQAVEDYASDEDYQEYYDQQVLEFKEDFIAQCFDDIQNRETYTLNYISLEYQYTLYYYDQAGNLVKTVPPLGVNKITDEQDLADVKAYRSGSGTTFIHPAHTYETVYSFNSLQQNVKSNTPDAGETQVWFDFIGRTVASQNAKQLADGTYSYVLYDQLSRPFEAGLLLGVAPPTETVLSSDNEFLLWVNGGTRSEVSYTWYDKAMTNPDLAGEFGTQGQENLRNRVASSAYMETYASPVEDNYDNASHYSYDIHGNVSLLIQENRDLQEMEQDYKSISYSYDILSGNVKELAYQDGEWDQFYHRYCYDNNNRLHEVLTSKDGLIWEKDAKYFYYAQGPLARVELGHEQVNATDYAYNLQGWLKGANSNTLRRNRDIGQDGAIASTSNQLNEMFAEDAFGYSLSYYTNDFKAIGPQQDANYFLVDETGSQNLMDESPDLFNGNMARMITAHSQEVMPLAGQTMNIHANAYQYDQAQRIKKSQVLALDYGYIGFDLYNYLLLGSSVGTDFMCNYSYDANGNITQLQRNGHSLIDPNEDLMDVFTYHYEYQQGVGELYENNKLNHVSELNSAYEDNYDQDLDGQILDNYSYDAIGQLVGDATEGIDWIEWSASGKIRHVIRTGQIGGNYMSDFEFEYDAGGNRLCKIEKPRDTNGDLKDQSFWVYTYYVLDSQGNTLTTYSRTFEDLPNGYADILAIDAQHVYGSSRLGQRTPNREASVKFLNSVFVPQNYNYGGHAVTELTFSGGDFETPVLPTVLSFYERNLGLKAYELSNQLGNVLATIRDAKKGNDDGTGKVDFYSPRVYSLTDYYPFGMTMPGRNYSSDSYRYGFNGMEKDDEFKGVGNSYDFGARMYDPRICRFPSLDPMMNQRVGFSPYEFAANSPIQFIDENGEFPLPVLLEFMLNYGIPYLAKETKTTYYAGLDLDGGAGLGILSAGFEGNAGFAIDPLGNYAVVGSFGSFMDVFGSGGNHNGADWNPEQNITEGADWKWGWGFSLGLEFAAYPKMMKVTDLGGPITAFSVDIDLEGKWIFDVEFHDTEDETIGHSLTVGIGIGGDVFGSPATIGAIEMMTGVFAFRPEDIDKAQKAVMASALWWAGSIVNPEFDNLVKRGIVEKTEDSYRIYYEISQINPDGSATILGSWDVFSATKVSNKMNTWESSSVTQAKASYENNKDGSR